MATFRHKYVRTALEAAIKAADHLEPQHAATVAAARALAAKIDAWDQIVDWALEDAAETDSRPRVPANDNTSLPTFLKYMESLRLTPPAAGKGGGEAGGKQAVSPAPVNDPAGKIVSMQQRVANRKAQ